MSDFLERFRSKSNKVGKSGIIQGERGYESVTKGGNKGVGPSYIYRSKSNETIKNTQKFKGTQLPRIKTIVDNNPRSHPTLLQPQLLPTLSRTKLLKFIKESQAQIKQSLLSSPIPPASGPHPNPSQSPNSSPFNVPSEKWHPVLFDEMRFLKSFQEYKSVRHFSIHRKMSQRTETKASS